MHKLPSHIAQLLSSIRKAIYLYVWLEGLFLILSWLGFCFLVGLAIDYLPVRFGAYEMSSGTRITLWLVIGLGSLWIAYFWILRRIFSKLSDRSMAILLERRFPAFKDSLLTAVELHEKVIPSQPASKSRSSQSNIPQKGTTSGTLNRLMFEQTLEEVKEALPAVKITEIFNFFPLLRNFTTFSIGAISILLLALFAQETFSLWRDRLIFMAETEYPRQTELTLKAIRVQGTIGNEDFGQLLDIKQHQSTPHSLSFNADRTVTVPIGSHPVIIVKANTEKVIPQHCKIYYRSADGTRGSDFLKKKGNPKDGFQEYLFDGRPFLNIQTSIRFDIIGNDFRLQNYHIKVKQAPAIAETKLAIDPPNYLKKYTGKKSQPELPYRLGTQIHQGSQVKLTCKSTAPLKGIYIYDLEKQEGKQQAVKLSTGQIPEQFEYNLLVSREDKVLEIYLVDQHGLISKSPTLVTLVAIPDELPQFREVLPSGIGEYITPIAKIPISCKVSDDLGLKQTWFRFYKNGAKKRLDQVPFSLSKPNLPKAELEQANLDPDNIPYIDQLDLLKLRSRSKNPIQFKPGDRLKLHLVAQDICDLPRKPHEKVQVLPAPYDKSFKVVSGQELQAHLEADELQLRRALMNIQPKLEHARDLLIRARKVADVIRGAPLSKKALEKLQLQVTWLHISYNECQNNLQPLRDIQSTFSRIREELINNRIKKSEKRQKRLQEEIINKLDKINSVLLPEQIEQHIRLYQTEQNLLRELRVATEAEQQQILKKIKQHMETEGFHNLKLANQTLDQLDEIIKALLEQVNLQDLIQDLEAIHELIQKQKKRIKKEQFKFTP